MCEMEDIYLDYLLFEMFCGGDDEGEGDSGSDENDNESEKKVN